jgi:hypothetical protein
MIMNNRFIRNMAAIGIATLMVIFSFADGTVLAASAASKNLAAGSNWAINETTSLTDLNIAKGATITAPKGYSITMTVNGVETPVKAGDYKGNIVLTVTRDIVIKVSVFGDVSAYNMRAAVDVEDGKYIQEKSVTAAAVGGKVTDASTKDVSINSVGDYFNGIIVQGNSTYSIDNVKMNLTGHGGNDFAGYGAGIMTDGKANVTINKATIVTKGAIRTAIAVRENSTVHVNDTEIYAQNGPLPEDYAFKWQKPVGALMQVPWFLGLVGTNRATMLVDSGTAYYNNTHIKAQGWGALSTDSVKDIHLYATNCHIEVIESGYGSYADGSNNSFSKCVFDVKDYALIMTGGTGIFTDGCVVNSGRFGVMFHGAGNLTIDKGSVFNTKEAVIQVKGGFPTIVVDNAKFNPENGLILQAMVNDDPNKGGGSGGGAPAEGSGGGAPEAGGQGGAPGAAPGGGGQGGAPAGGQGGMPAAVGAPAGGGTPGGMPGGPGGGSSAVNATFKNMTMTGDIVNSMTAQGDVIVNFEKATITGAISTATAEHGVGPKGEKLIMKEETDLYYLIGKTKETLCETNDKYGVKVSLGNGSKWVVSKTSYLTGLTIADGAAITAPQGYKVTMTVDGTEKAIKAGAYKGKIVLSVAKS